MDLIPNQSTEKLKSQFYLRDLVACTGGQGMATVSGRVSIQLFRERLLEKMCMRQSRKVIWDMINTLFLTTVAVKLTFVAFL